jgi:hypothetical protein
MQVNALQRKPGGVFSRNMEHAISMATNRSGKNKQNAAWRLCRITHGESGGVISLNFLGLR